MTRFGMIGARLVLVGGALALGGCAAKEKVVVDPYPRPETLSLLSQSAARAAQAQETLARIQSARTAPAPKPLAEGMAGVPAELRRPTTIEWSGPGEEAARRVAEIVGWRFVVIGQAPATVPMVSVSYAGQPAVKVIEDIGFQSAPFANVVADARSKRIEYRYLDDGRAHAPRRTGELVK